MKLLITRPFLSPKVFLSTPLYNAVSPMFFPSSVKLSFTPIQNGNNYTPIYGNICIFRQQTGRQNIMDRILAGIPGI